MTPLVNGINYDWASVSFVLFGIPVSQIVDINYERKQKKENNYGAGPYPVSRGYGNVECDGTIEMYLDVWKQIIALSPNRDPLQLPPFDIPVVYGNNGQVPAQDTLRSVEFLSDPFKGKQGDTKLMVTIPLIIGQIDR
jgi:hypothetical protein